MMTVCFFTVSHKGSISNGQLLSFLLVVGCVQEARIANEILMYFRSLKKTAGDVYINDPIESDKDGNPLTLLDIVADETNIADMIDLKIESEKLRGFVIGNLEPRERIIIELRYGLTGGAPLTQREIAKQLGISRSYVSRIEKSAIEKLRTFFDS